MEPARPDLLRIDLILETRRHPLTGARAWLFEGKPKPLGDLLVPASGGNPDFPALVPLQNAVSGSAAITD